MAKIGSFPSIIQKMHLSPQRVKQYPLKCIQIVCSSTCKLLRAPLHTIEDRPLYYTNATMYLSSGALCISFQDFLPSFPHRQAAIFHINVFFRFTVSLLAFVSFISRCAGVILMMCA